ncbi:hypothetical protein [Stenotrophomonas maltophilia]
MYAVLLPFRQMQKDRAEQSRVALVDAEMALERFGLGLISIATGVALGRLMLKEGIEEVRIRLPDLITDFERVTFPILPALPELQDMRRSLQRLQACLDVMGGYRDRLVRNEFTEASMGSLAASLDNIETAMNIAVVMLEDLVPHTQMSNYMVQTPQTGPVEQEEGAVESRKS